jgi:hypothetical protein
VLKKWTNALKPEDTKLKEFEMLKYFVTGYFNTGYSWSELEERTIAFRDDEKPEYTIQLKRSLSRLQELINNGDQKRWVEVQKYIYELSMRDLEFKRGQEFIDRVNNALDS